MNWLETMKPWLPKNWYFALQTCDPSALDGAQELRARNGDFLFFRGKRDGFTNHRVQTDELEAFLLAACDYAPVSAAYQFRAGYLSPGYGFRIGVTGKYQQTSGFYRPVEAVCVRIPHTLEHVGDHVFEQLWEQNRLCSTLILAPPGGGKTTLLRDFIRLARERHLQVGVVDERGELADGMKTGGDVLEGMEKAESIRRLLQTMRPQVIAVDEIGGEEDVKALQQLNHCGVDILATAHGDGVQTLEKTNLLPLKEIFRKAVLLDAVPGRHVQVVTI